MGSERRFFLGIHHLRIRSITNTIGTADKSLERDVGDELPESALHVNISFQRYTNQWS